MKIIFLDIDGVLNSIEYSVGMRTGERKFRLYDADPVKIGLLRWLVKQTGAKIVISSTWRLGHTPMWFVGYFEREGWPDPPIISCTPRDLPDGKNGVGRGDEVQAWIEDDQSKVGEDISYVIFDDDSDFYDWQPLIKCNALHGLTLGDVIKAIDILGLGSQGDKDEVESLRKHVDFKPQNRDN